MLPAIANRQAPVVITCAQEFPGRLTLTTEEQGAHIRALVEARLLRGEPVVVDFAGFEAMGLPFIRAFFLALQQTHPVATLRLVRTRNLHPLDRWIVVQVLAQVTGQAS